ncbi:maleylpyruvate isomerase family mycothiol-dependent enzyme [Promicromonospora vindobonensis]|uniref:Maleylpyruvate isomerase family mycothiol-dependent enzyme n=1 Tax=Promicromonospora vindobonensis TaxID=195748 RepID=A0ABW5VXR8_9MICO
MTVTAREALRLRQGAGARYDAPEAPAEALAWARLGSAYFARVLNDLPDAALYEPSALPGWTRAHVVAHVGYNARALVRLVGWARTGETTPMYASAKQRDAEIERGSTLPARALRHLAAHAAIHLDVEWRDLPGAAWTEPVVTAQGRAVPVSETAWMRTREVWVHAVDLADASRGVTPSFANLPAGVLERLRDDVLGTWARRGEPVDVSGVQGTLPDLVRWLTGRGEGRLRTTDDHDLPELPRWL